MKDSLSRDGRQVFKFGPFVLGDQTHFFLLALVEEQRQLALVGLLVLLDTLQHLQDILHTGQTFIVLELLGLLDGPPEVDESQVCELGLADIVEEADGTADEPVPSHFLEYSEEGLQLVDEFGQH